jgi:PKD repeat protein
MAATGDFEVEGSEISCRSLRLCHRSTGSRDRVANLSRHGAVQDSSAAEHPLTKKVFIEAGGDASDSALSGGAEQLPDRLAERTGLYYRVKMGLLHRRCRPGGWTRAAAVALAAVLAAVAAGAARSAPDATLVAGADWLLLQQAPSGAYPWTLGQPPNDRATGAVARGMLGSYLAVGDARYRDASIRTGELFVTSAPRRFPDGSADLFANDVLFLEELSIATGNPRYGAFVQAAFWDRLAAGTYGANADQDAAEWAAAMPEWPEFAGWISLKPYYRAIAAVAAQQAGEPQARNAFVAELVRSLERMTLSDRRSDLTGIAAAVWASALTGMELDPKAGRWASLNSTADFVATLVRYQRPGGDWPYDTSAAGARHVGDVSVTTWSVEALEAWNAATHAGSITRGLAFIRSQQQPSGQILTNPGYATTTTTGVLVHSDALAAIALDRGIVSGPLPPALPPTAAFAATPVSGQAPLTVAFTDASSGSPTSWAWDFDANGTVDSTAQNPQFTYTAAGTYTVRLTVSSAAGSDEELRPGLVTVSTPPPASQTSTFAVAEDAYVSSSDPKARPGGTSTLRARDTTLRSYVKFTVTGTQGPSRVTLRLYVTDATPGIVQAYSVASSTWTESRINWETSPPLGGLVGTSPAPTAGAWIEIDVGTIPGNGVYSYALTLPNSDPVWFSSREGGNPAQLVARPA